MGVRVNTGRCDGCRQAKEPACVHICPGDLFFLGADKAVRIRDISECWDCAACVKSCPRQALEMYLPVQMGGKGAVLTAHTRGKEINWHCSWPGGKEENFLLQVKN